MTIPVWVYVVFFGILFSAYMTVKSVKEEDQFERERIEKEGEVYMFRLREEKKRNKIRLNKVEGQ